MGIIRLITVVAVIWLVWFFFKRFQQNLINRKQAAVKSNNTVSSVKKCAECGVHVPESEALEHNGLYYCSASHKKSSSSNK
ncbi:MAG: PP0621 family protein [Gammaproteobacteria bacterium]|nr:PP0621 family protein [Gammaproteobacteria bacterium]